MLNERKIKHITPLAVVVVVAVIGTVVMWLGGYPPMIAYQALFQKIFGSVYDHGEIIRAVIPLVLSGLAVAIANKGGIFNIGVDGQITIGAVASLLVGVYVDLPPVLHGIVAMMVGMIAGGVWAVLIAGLKTRFGINEVISSIMMNYIALYLGHMIIRNFVMEAGTQRSLIVQDSALLASPFLSSLFNGARVHWGLLLVPILVWGYQYFFEKTRFGFETKVVGSNMNAATYAGISVSKVFLRTMFISGALGGLIGSLDTLGVSGYVTIAATTSGIGFDGVAIALLGSNTAIGTTIAAMIIGALNYGAQGMQFQAGVPSEIIGIMISLAIFFVAAPKIIENLLPKAKEKQSLLKGVDANVD